MVPPPHEICTQLTLRQRAEAQLADGPLDAEIQSDADLQRLVHELQVHQVELELQNEELRRSQAELQTARDRYAALYDFAPVGYLTLDHQGIILEANLTAAAMLGVARSELTGTPLTRWIVRADQDTFYHHRRQVFDADVPQSCDLHLRQPDDTPFVAHVESRAVAADTGSARWCHTTLSDITARQQAADTLRDSEERFRDLIEGSIQGILIHRNFKPLFVNAAYAEMFGYNTPAAFLATLHAVDQLAAPHERARLKGYARARMRGADAPDAHEYEGRRQDGSTIWVENRVRVVNWEGVPAIQSTTVDITRKRAETQLALTLARVEASRDDLREILDQLRLGNVMTDEHERITFCSQACQAFCELDLEETAGQPWMQVFPFTPQDRAELAAMGKRPQRMRAPVSLRLHTPNNRHYWVDIELHDDPRDPRRTIILFYDTTEVHDLRRLLDDQTQFHGMIGASSAMLPLYQLIDEVAGTDATVLIEGETGTGKELVARAIHGLSPRQGKPFVAVNCASLTESVVTSQLFGHKRGAFTGAIADHQGLLEAADGGTLFLDEVGDMSQAVQTSLLRVLQEREITRVGESRPRSIDVRILAATHRDLAAEVAAGRFREDLLYRLRVVRLPIPSLRDRPTDIPLLVSAFLAQNRGATRKPVREVSYTAMRRLLVYAWPGNVRELQGAVESAMIRCQGRVIQETDLPPELRQEPELRLTPTTFDDDERQRVLDALRQTGGNRAAAARLLGMGRTTLYRRLARFNLVNES